MKIRILPGDFGNYVSRGGSWDESRPDEASFEVDLMALPVKGSAVLFTSPHPATAGQLRVGEVQEVVIGESFIYVFVPHSVQV